MSSCYTITATKGSQSGELLLQTDKETQSIHILPPSHPFTNKQIKHSYATTHISFSIPFSMSHTVKGMKDKFYYRTGERGGVVFVLGVTRASQEASHTSLDEGTPGKSCTGQLLRYPLPDKCENVAYPHQAC